MNSNSLDKIRAYYIATRKILNYALSSKQETIQGTTAEGIIRTIINNRVNQEFLFTGGHYTDFYIRNLGTFANKLVDPLSTQSDQELHKQVSLINKSIALALKVFAENNQITTTIVKVNDSKYVPINIYVQPSDSLPSILKILYQLKDKDNLQKYEHFLRLEINKFVSNLTDSTGLIRKDTPLSGIKDAWIRKSSFYDNIMLYSVYDLADKLQLLENAAQLKINLKQKILTSYWDDKKGIFFDESPGNGNSYFSADTLIAYEMNFLDPSINEDKIYLEKIIKYIQTNKLDKPFPLKATEIRIPEKEHWPVRIFAPNYIGTTIWSYWGMVYINILIDLQQIDYAQECLNQYTKNILKYHGFPELYTPEGELYKTTFYHSVIDMIWGIYYLYLQNKLKAVSPPPTTAADDE